MTGTIPAELTLLDNLEHLDLSENQLTGRIPSPHTGGLSKLRVLNLGWNRLSGTIPAELTRLQQLDSLRVSGNQLSGTIPGELALLNSLEYLHLDGTS